MNYHELLRETEDHVNLFYRDHIDANLFYHNQHHALEVLEDTKKIADHYQLDDRSFFIVCAAACFNDLGHRVKNLQSDEKQNAEMGGFFLNSIGAAEAEIEDVKKCILSTTMPQQPESLNEKIVCDADLFNLGTGYFQEKNKLLRREMEALGNTKIDRITWRASTINLLENHRYHTDYCQLLLNKTKAQNLEKIKSRQEEKINKIKEAVRKEANVDENNGTVLNAVQTPKNSRQQKKDRPLRGIETMFRISASKNIRISEMADNKANIMISVNSIIISVILGLMAKSLEENRNLIIPTVILLIVNVATIIFSVLATRPKIANGYFTKEEVENRSVNLLYFGTFYKMSFQDYDAGLKEMMADSDFLYGSLSKDTYSQGMVLGRKYRLLRISYTIFLYGIVAAVLAFSLAVIFF